EEAGIRVQTRQGEDPAAQDVVARQLIADAFDPAPVSISRMVVSEPRTTARDGDTLDGRLVVMGSDTLQRDAPDIEERLELVEGTLPDRTAEPVQGLLHVATASAWEVGVGDTLQVTDQDVTVSGLWRPVDTADPTWFGDRLVVAGRDGTERGPLLVAPEQVGQFVAAPFIRWAVQPDTDEILPGDLAHLADAAATLQGTLRTPEVEVNGVTVDGDLAPTAATASTHLSTASALGAIPLSILVLVTLLAVSQLARLLATTREAQAGLLVARGATRVQVLVSTLVEAAVVTALGTGLGALVAWGVLHAVPAGNAQGGTVLRVAVATGAAILLVLAIVATLQVRRLSAGGTTTHLSGRSRAATALTTLVLVGGGAAVAWWQLRRTGSPLVTRDDGTHGTDLIAGAAPALLLAAAAVLAMALLGPGSRLVEALTRPGRTAAGHLASSQVSRRLSVYAVPAVLTVLAVGATTVSGLYAGTAAALRDDLTGLAAGAPIRATLVPQPVTNEPGVITPPPPDFTDVSGVERATLVWQDPNARLADVVVPMTVSRLPELARTATVPARLQDELGL
ncbi:MAG: hypothetical protein Q4G34_12105, partial [Micrococcus sp.]|nr:hypothetical protein [Micrococcus sp.]